MGAGNTEVYLLEDRVPLGVYTVNGAGTVVSSYFNLLAEDRAIGRRPSVGSRSFYHTDLLGSTRAVVQGATVTESYDYDPWGVLLPGRTLGSGTKEQFTTKERDGETGLDYFGARSYASAIGRWTTVDPADAADGAPEWGPYGYVKGNPVSRYDALGLCIKNDVNCKNLVRSLRKQKGSEFRAAADRYDSQSTGRVFFYAKPQNTSRWDHFNVDGDPTTYSLGNTRGTGGDVFLRGDVSTSDHLLAAVHESVHLAGVVRETEPTYAAWRAYNQLSTGARSQAIFNSNFFYQLWGRGYGAPLPASVTESRERQSYFVPPRQPE